MQSQDTFVCPSAGGRSRLVLARLLAHRGAELQRGSHSGFPIPDPSVGDHMRACYLRLVPRPDVTSFPVILRPLLHYKTGKANTWPCGPW